MIETALFTFHTGTEGFASHFTFPEINRWTLAVCRAALFFPRVLLITDEYGRYLLRERLELPFTADVVCLDQVPKRLSFLPCAAKLWGYREAADLGLPFLGLDGDVFLWRKPAPHLLAAPAVVQEVHGIDPGLVRLIDQMSSLHPSMPRAEKTCCGGLLGGNDLTGLLAYSEQAIDLLIDPRLEPHYRACLPARWRPVSACEEALFVAHFADRLQTFTPAKTPPAKTTRADMDRAGIEHLVGHKGTAPDAAHYELRVETRIGLDFPAYRRRIADLWWGDLSLQPPA